MSDVSRETPSAPDVARRVFSDALPALEAFAGLLATDGVLRGLIGPREVPRLWERHLVNCGLLAEALDGNLDVADIGSGAGLPGLVLALARPDLRVSLVEPLLRRTNFLSEAVERLGADNVEVIRSRAEDLHGRRDFDVVTSRAVAPLARLARWSLPLVRAGGEMVAMKGLSVDDEARDAAATVSELGGRTPVIEVYGANWVDPPMRALRIRAGEPSAKQAAEQGKHGRSGRSATKKPRSGKA